MVSLTPQGRTLPQMGGTLLEVLGTPWSAAAHLPSCLHGHMAIYLCVYVCQGFLSYCKNAGHWIRVLPTLV